ncbi:STYKc [Musa troglodytarum]|uniref:non-specific serine/threonine protein kinase n=1 Tax=Musa troglodytarum TaxID=320322 RepID=A0A9E7GY50_9LILI|nr:STYKc [Musa troglodytarum]
MCNERDILMPWKSTASVADARRELFWKRLEDVLLKMGKMKMAAFYYSSPPPPPPPPPVDVSPPESQPSGYYNPSQPSIPAPASDADPPSPPPASQPPSSPVDAYTPPPETLSPPPPPASSPPPPPPTPELYPPPPSAAPPAVTPPPPPLSPPPAAIPPMSPIYYQSPPPPPPSYVPPSRPPLPPPPPPPPALPSPPPNSAPASPLAPPPKVLSPSPPPPPPYIINSTPPVPSSMPPRSPPSLPLPAPIKPNIPSSSNSSKHTGSSHGSSNALRSAVNTSETVVTVAVVAGLVMLTFVGAAVWLVKKHKKPFAPTAHHGNLVSASPASSHASGRLRDGREVAVKRLKVGGAQGEREFKSEVETISRVHHRHLVSLVRFEAQARPLLIQTLENGDFGDLPDPRLDGNYNKDEMFRMIEIAAACTRHSSTMRPRMGRIVVAICGRDQCLRKQMDRIDVALGVLHSLRVPPDDLKPIVDGDRRIVDSMALAT